MDLKKLFDLGQRDFDPKETIKVLTHNRNIWWSWGVPTSSIKIIGTKGLLFKVSGNHYKGLVYITLSWMDLYDVHFLNRNGDVKGEKIEGLFFDQLVEVIDNRIERIPDYKF
jgi:hypothetical protein